MSDYFFFVCTNWMRWSPRWPWTEPRGSKFTEWQACCCIKKRPGGPRHVPPPLWGVAGGKALTFYWGGGKREAGRESGPSRRSRRSGSAQQVSQLALKAAVMQIQPIQNMHVNCGVLLLSTWGCPPPCLYCRICDFRMHVTHKGPVSDVGVSQSECNVGLCWLAAFSQQKWPQ